MASIIPGLDVTELPNDRASLRQFVSDPGPGNPNVGPGGSTQAQELRASTQGIRAAPVQQALAAEARAPSALVRGATNLGRTVGAGLRTTAPAIAAGAVADHFNDYKLNDPGVDSSAMGTLRAIGHGDFAGAGRSLQKGAVETALDLGSGLSNIADLVVPGKAPVSTAFNKMVHGDLGNQVVDQTSANRSNPDRSGFTTAGPLPPQVSPGFRGPTDETGPATSASAVPSGAGLSASAQHVPGYGPEAQAIDARTSSIRNSMIPIQKQLDGFGPGAHTADGSGGYADLGGHGPMVVARNQADFDKGQRQHTLEDALNHGNSHVKAAALSELGKGDVNGSALAAEGLRQQGENVRAIALNNTNRSIHADANAVSIRGQDATLAGHRMANDVAVANQRREQFNSDRTYNAGRTDAGNAQETKHAEMRVQASKALPEEIAGMLPPGPDGKPDLANAARHAQGMTNAVADLMNNPNTPPEVRAKIQREGVGALDQGDKRKLVAGMQLTDVVNATATGGMTPWGTRAIESNTPITAIKKLPNGDYQTNRRGVNGETEIIPGRYIEKEGSTLGIGGRASDKFKALME